MGQIALAWSLAKEGVTAPIIGTTKLENLKEAIGSFGLSLWSLITRSNRFVSYSDALDVKLTEEEIKYLEEPYQPTRIIGHQ